jgi:hypothetical protein
VARPLRSCKWPPCIFFHSLQCGAQNVMVRKIEAFQNALKNSTLHMGIDSSLSANLLMRTWAGFKPRETVNSGFA